MPNYKKTIRIGWSFSLYLLLLGSYSAPLSTHTVKPVELSRYSFDPVLRHGYDAFMAPDGEIDSSLELVMWADHIVFAYPIWWGGMPSLLSGWVTSLFTPGATFRYHGVTRRDQLLRGKTADIIVTARAPRILWLLGVNDSAHSLTRNLFALTGIKKRKMLALDRMSLPADTDERRQKFLRRVQAHAARL